MADGETVHTGELVLNFAIRQWDQDGEVMYDWVVSNGDESDMLFECIEWAIDDVRNRY